MSRIEMYFRRGKYAQIFVGRPFLLAIGVDLELRSAYMSVATRKRRYAMQVWPKFAIEVYQ